MFINKSLFEFYVLAYELLKTARHLAQNLKPFTVSVRETANNNYNLEIKTSVQLFSTSSTTSSIAPLGNVCKHLFDVFG